MLSFNEFISKDVIKAFLKDFADTFDLKEDESSWFSSIKALGVKHGFADDRKVYKKNPSQYQGWYADAISLIRIAVSGSNQAPKLYDVLKILGKDEVVRRVEEVLALI